jgi:hypothetical protein
VNDSPIIFVFLCACSAPARSNEAAVPLAVSPPPISTSEEVSLPQSAMLARSREEGAWAATFPEAATFRAITVPKSSRVILEWRVTARDHAPHRAGLDLRVRSRNVEETLSFGELENEVDPANQSYCWRAGWSTPWQWQWIPNPSVSAWFAMGNPQASYSELMIVRDPDVLYVIRHERTSGGCEWTQQGPLAICPGAEFERVAEIHGTRDAGLFDLITIDGRDIRCGAARRGERLVKP